MIFGKFNKLTNDLDELDEIKSELLNELDKLKAKVDKLNKLKN